MDREKLAHFPSRDFIAGYKAKVALTFMRAYVSCYLFLGVVLIFLYGLKYSSAYTPTSHASRVNTTAPIHFRIVVMLFSIMLSAYMTEIS